MPTSVKAFLTILVLAAAALAMPARAQEARYAWEFGGAIGMSGYNGDANHGFPFSHPGIAASLLGRHNIDSRWSLRAEASLATLSGNTADLDEALPGGAQYEFKSTLWGADVRAEFNFFPYGIGETYKRLRRWTPFVSVGLGFNIAKVEGRTFSAAEVPFGIGVKFKPSQRVNLAAELTMAKTFGDHIDGAALSDLYTIKSSFLKNTDWHSALTVSLTYEFGERCPACNRKD